MKFVPTRLVKAHFRTFVNARNGRPHVPDYIVAFAPPIASGAAIIATKTHVDAAVSGGVLTAAGLFGAFLFGVMLQVSQRALDWVDTDPRRGPKTSNMARNLEELAANAGYSSLMAIIAAVFFLASSATTGWANTVALALGVSIGLHMILVLVMVMNRVFLMTQAQLNLARSGGSHAEIVPMDPDQRSSQG